MATKWAYSFVEYDTEAEAIQAAADLKARLDNNPTDWCSVKVITGSEESGWVVPPEGLSDAEILNLSPDNTYMISSSITGDSFTGLTADQVNAKVAEIKVEYAKNISADKIYKQETIDLNDMATYVV